MFFFTAKDGTAMYMGKDKFENEDLIKYGWPEDVWFHVDNLSSAHVYVRLAPGQTMADISDEVVRDCAQLVKENSIEGCKKASVPVIYTPWANLRKDGSMATGQVSFHNPANVKKYIVLERDKETLRRLEKTREERHPDLCAERAQRDAEEKAKWKAEGRAKAKAEQELREERCAAAAGGLRAVGCVHTSAPARVWLCRGPWSPCRLGRCRRHRRTRHRRVSVRSHGTHHPLALRARVGGLLLRVRVVCVCVQATRQGGAQLRPALQAQGGGCGRRRRRQGRQEAAGRGERCAPRLASA